MFNLFNKIFSLTYKFNKKDVIKLNFILIFSSLIEGLSIALIFPILGLILDNKESYLFFEKIPYITIDPDKALMFALFFLVTIFLLKAITLLYFSWWKSGFIYNINNKFSKQVFENYLNEDFEFYLKNKPSLLLRNAFGEIRVFVQSIDLFFRLLTEIIIFILITFILFIFQPKITLGIFAIFGTIGFLFLYFTKNMLKSWGNSKLNFSGKLIQILQQSFESIKYLKISNLSEKATEDYAKNIRGFSKYSRFALFFSDIPKNFLEFISVIILIFTILFLFKFYGTDFQSIIPTLGLIGAASFRMIPGVHRIVNITQGIYNMNSSIQVVYSELIRTKKINVNTKDKILLNDTISFEDVAYIYPNSKNHVFQNLNFEIKKGDCLCIKGESGIGKTTIIDLISGLLKPSHGKIKIDGKSLKDIKAIRSWQNNIGYVPQQTVLYNATILENITYGRNYEKNDEENLNKAINYSELNDFIKEKQGGLNYEISERGGNLSGGQIQRFAIARGLFTDPDILICDEFTSSLDNPTQEKILNSLNNLVGKTTIIFISHNNKVIERANKILEVLKDQNGKTIVRYESK